MSLACSIHTVRTVWPLMSIPRMFWACSRSLGLVVGQLHSTGLAAPADQHLGLDDDRVAHLVRGRHSVLDGGHGLACRHLQPVAGEQLLALVLEQVHVRRETLADGGRNARRGVRKA